MEVTSSSPSSSPLTKETLRRAMRETLQTHAHERRAHSDRLWQHLLAWWPTLGRRETVLVYLDFGVEVETLRFLGDLWAVAPVLVVPAVVGDELRLVRLERINSPGKFVRGVFGIPEPPVAIRDDPRFVVLPDAIDAAILPGLAFDAAGHRLGRGGGFFDHLLPRLPASTPRIALAFECQCVPHVPTELHDVPVDWIATEQGVRAVEANANEPC